MEASALPALPPPGSPPRSLPGSPPGSPPAPPMPPTDLCLQRPPPPEPSSLPRADSEDAVTSISEGTTVTSADEEKLQLLNRNTELRRINEELVRLNREWEHMHRGTTQALQQRVRALQREALALRQQAEGLTAKLEHEQSRREYYEQTLIQELRKNQQLQEHLRQLESSQHRRQDGWDARALLPSSWPLSPLGPPRSLEAGGKALVCAEPLPRVLGSEHRGARAGGCSEQEVTDLKDQLEALRCQTEIYEADYRTEHRDRERIEAENEQLRRREEETRQQVLLLQEQLRIFEEDFRKERSDKRLLQHLLKSKAAPAEPVLVHRCSGHGKAGAASNGAPRAEGPGQGLCAACANTRLPASRRDY